MPQRLARRARELITADASEYSGRLDFFVITAIERELDLVEMRRRIQRRREMDKLDRDSDDTSNANAEVIE